MKKCEAPVDTSRKQGGILVVRLHDQAAALEALEVLGECERHTRASFAEGGVRDRELAELLHERDPWVLDSPELLRIVVRVGPERRLAVDRPSVAAVPPGPAADRAPSAAARAAAVGGDCCRGRLHGHPTEGAAGAPRPGPPGVPAPRLETGRDHRTRLQRLLVEQYLSRAAPEKAVR